MILHIRDLNGKNDYYGDGFEWVISKRFLRKSYSVTLYCKGFFFESQPSYRFKTKEDAKKFVEYVSDRMEGDYMHRDIRPILKKLYKIT